MRFAVPPEGLLNSDSDLSQIYVSGYDGRVFASRVEFDAGHLVLRRMNSDSCKLHVPWRVEGFGRPVVSTATLRESDQIYILPLELARGKICQVRNQLAAWEGLGMQIPEEFRDIHRDAHSHFARATTIRDSDPEEAIRLSNAAISAASRAAEVVTRSYVRQRLSVRLKRTPQLPVSIGCGLNCPEAADIAASAFGDTFNAAVIPIEWRQIEPSEGDYNWKQADALVDWCHDRKLLMRGGPLLDLSPNGLPDWLQQWGHDFFNLQSFLCDFVETAISRYAGRIRLWEVSSRVNTGGAFDLNEEERLTLVARTLEVARQVDEESKLVIRIEDPWGSYQSQGRHRLSPIQFVDALLRCGIGLSGVNLEVAIGYSQRGSGYRDLLDFSRLLDQWSVLEVPLHVTLAMPGSAEPDGHSDSSIAVTPNGWRVDWSGEAQAAWIEEYVPLMMAKQAIVGIYWSHLSDSNPHVFPNAGLVNASGGKRAGLDAFHKLRNWQPTA